MKHFLLSVLFAVPVLWLSGGEVQTKLLGNPAPGGYQLNGTKAYGRNIWDMVEYRGKILFSFGNASNEGPAQATNSAGWGGPVPIMSWDPKTRTFTVEHRTHEEQISFFRIGDDGGLYTAGIDAAGPGKFVYLYYTDPKTGRWNEDKLPGIHLYDATCFRGRRFAGSRSTADGVSWESTRTAPGVGNFMQFPHALFYVMWRGAQTFRCLEKPKTIRNKDMFSGQAVTIQEYWTETNLKHESLLPGIKQEIDRKDPKVAAGKTQGSIFFTAFRMTPFGPDKNLYLAGTNMNDHQLLPVGATLFEATADKAGTSLKVRAIPIGKLRGMGVREEIEKGRTAPRIWDILVKERQGRRVVCVLVEDQPDRDSREPVTMRVFRSEGKLDRWTELFSFRVPTFARSFEYLDGVFYFGLGCEIRQVFPRRIMGINERGVNDHTGEIHAVSRDLFR